MILVTGSIGTVGKEVIRGLREGNTEFRVLTSKEAEREALEGQGVDAVPPYSLDDHLKENLRACGDFAHG